MGTQRCERASKALRTASIECSELGLADTAARPAASALRRAKSAAKLDRNGLSFVTLREDRMSLAMAADEEAAEMDALQELGDAIATLAAHVERGCQTTGSRWSSRATATRSGE